MNNDDYSKKQKSLDAKYEREYRAWVESLPANERRDLEAMGLHAPCVQRHGNGSAHGDAADSSMMAVGSDPAEMPEPEVEEHDADHGDPDAVNSAVRRVVAEIIYHDNARLTAECIALISGLSYDGCSMTEIAKRHGITRAAVSKRCVEMTELLGLRPSRAMRSLTARKRYRDARIRTTRSHERTYHPA